jgi:hypothetical protein
MKRILFVIILICNCHFGKLIAQGPLYKPKGDWFELTYKGASQLASLPLKCLEKEFPNKTNHSSNKDSDHVLLPKQLHPSFYGCFDWHSSVHGHWMLIRLMKEFPAIAETTSARNILDHNLSKENILKEVDYFSIPMTSSWERTYGWAWILKLDQELITWDDVHAKGWHQNLQPLTKKIKELWLNYLPKQTYPNRTGVHPNTAFGLVLALDYARSAKDTGFERKLVNASKQLFLLDKNIPASWEPNGSDFLSPALEEADLMVRILPKNEFLKWFNAFISREGLRHLTILPLVSDRSDLQIVHLDGLCFSRAWTMRSIAGALPLNDERRKLLIASAKKHLETALPNIVSGEYGGEHWLASFAVYALME